MRTLYSFNSDQSIASVDLTHNGLIEIAVYVGGDHTEGVRAAKRISATEAKAMAQQILAGLEHLEDGEEE